MAMKEQQRAVYRSMQGKEVDMAKLIMQNETIVAVGNVRVNARGDELGPGGQIIRKREDVLAEYYRDHPGAARDEVIARPAPVAKSAPVEPEPVEETITAKLKTPKE